MTSSTLLFDRWASVYDSEPNPLLLLEERMLADLLPAITGADILDVGCGTGRWLKLLEPCCPASLTGVDPSPAMLAHARAKVAVTTSLKPGDAAALPSLDAALDLILASFVLSYLPDLAAFVRESLRVLRPGGHLLISDMHPVTAVARGWSRSFQSDGARMELPTQSRSIATVLEAFVQCGFIVTLCAEAPFGPPERAAFEQAGKLAEYEKLTAIPAIYLLKLQKPYPATIPPASLPDSQSKAAHLPAQIVNAPWSTGAETWCLNPLLIEAGRFTTEPGPAHAHAIDLSGYVLLPGLINAHDHLEFALFPNLGRTPGQPCYQNAAEWAREIHQQHATTIERHLKVPLDTRLWWGAIRNLLSGVTTVCHHNPLHSALIDPALPVHVVQHYGWAHSLTFDANLASRFAGTPRSLPFLLHAAEGIDSTSREELYILDRMGLLDSHTVLIHGLAFGRPEIELLDRRGASLILCPTSNDFLFAHTLGPSVTEALERTALGSDSPLTARGDLLDEIHFLRTTHLLKPTTLYRLVTSQPASLLRLGDKQGRILPSSPADLIAVPQTYEAPAATLAHLTLADVELVLLSGQVHLASPALYNRIPEPCRRGLHLLDIAGHQRWIRAPLPTLFASAEAVLGQGKLCLGNKEIHHRPH